MKELTMYGTGTFYIEADGTVVKITHKEYEMSLKRKSACKTVIRRMKWMMWAYALVQFIVSCLLIQGYTCGILNVLALIMSLVALAVSVVLWEVGSRL